MNASDPRDDGADGGIAAPRRSDARPWWERRVRRSWREGPGPLLRAAGALFRVGVEARNAAAEAGLLRPERASVPVLSVGGLTVGGSGKTPLASDLARRLGPDGGAAVVTHGFADEMRVHRELNPAAVVTGGRDRRAAVEAAAASGAELAVVDGGFQHRRLWRDADLVAVRARARPGGTATLPAGPHREGWSALARADAAVVVRRGEPAGRGRRLARWLARSFPDATVARCRLRPSGLRAANGAAREVGRPDPRVAVASIMYPEEFLARIREAGLRPETEFVYSDHAELAGDAAARVAEASGRRGAVGTLKDAVKLRETLPGRVPLWYAAEELVWEEGRRTLLARLGGRLGGDDRGGRR